MRSIHFLATLVVLSCLVTIARAQDVPRLSGVFPAGAQAGQTVEVTLRGSALIGAKSLLVSSGGGVVQSNITGEIAQGGATVDAAAKPLHQAKCANCHELRSPANRSYSPEQWAEVVERMVKQRSAPLNPDEQAKITTYLQAMSRAGELKVKVAVAKDALPGRRELRVVTANGVTTAATFEVGTLPEVVSQGAATTKEKPQALTLPVVVNGNLSQGGQRDWYSLSLKKGERVTLNLKAYRLNEVAQSYFNPALYLYDAAGNAAAKSTGTNNPLFGTDPVIDFTAPADGTYTLLVRDLLYHGNPNSVYRLAIGAGLPVDTWFAYGVVARPGETITPNLAASVPLPQGMTQATVAVPASAPSGMLWASTPAGEAPMVVLDAPSGGAPITVDPKDAPAVPLPAAFHGAITLPDSTKDAKAQNIFKVKTTRANVPMYFTCASFGSQLRPWVHITKPTGEYVNGYYADHATDFRWDNAFKEPGEYIVKVMDGDNKGGSNYTYVWTAYDASPDFAITATPDAANLLPGGTAVLTVRATRRENIGGPITVSVRDLPAGVTAMPCVIPPDDDKANLVLRAETTATVDARPVIIEGSYAGADGKPIVRRAQPIDFYRINNGAYRWVDHDVQTVAVAGSEPSPPVAVSVEGAENGIALVMNRENEVKVKLNRREGFKGDLFVVPMNFPPGISLRGNTYVAGDKSECALSLYADGNARFLKGERPAKDLPPMTIVFAIRSNGAGEADYIAATTPIPLSLKPTPEPPAK